MNENNVCSPAPSAKRDYSLQILLCDDNEQFLNELRDKVRAFVITQSIETAIWTFEDATKIPADILKVTDICFLDIDFPGKKYSGIDVARTLREKNPDSVIVFISNYIQYAPEGYEVQAFRYILKSEFPQKLEMYIGQTIERLKSIKEAMHIKVAGEIVSIELRDILYIEAQGHLAIIHAQKFGFHSRKTYTCYKTLAKIYEEYGSHGFLRIQKSYLVNARRIIRFQCNEATLDTGEKLPVSRKYYAEQKRQYLFWKGR